MTSNRSSRLLGRLVTLGAASALAVGCAATPDSQESREAPEDSALPLDDDSITVTSDGTTMSGALLGGGTAISITSASYAGGATASGTYVDGPLGLGNGVVLTTGAAMLSLPPNDGAATSQSNNLAGSPLCDALIPGYTSYDATTLTLTFDLAPGFDGISVLSIFGSEEYIEYVGTAFNDVYGIYLNGQQIAFDQNGDPITINGPFFSSSEVVVAPATETEYDGSTGLLQTKATLQGGSTGNVLEIVICDAGDTVLDSGVFISGLNGCVGDDCSGTVPCASVDDDGDGFDACVDCDDTNPGSNLGAPEACDGADNDCDGEVDEGGVCQPVCVTIQRGLSGDVADAYLSQASPSSNTGGSPNLYSGFSGGTEKRALVRFDLGGIPAGATVQSSTFTVYQTWTASTSTVRAHMVTEPWIESTVTWNNFNHGGFFDPAVVGSFTSSGSGHRTLDLKDLTQAWIDGAVANHGVLLEEDLVVRTSYRSSEHATQGHRPSLEVCYLP